MNNINNNKDKHYLIRGTTISVICDVLSFILLSVYFILMVRYIITGKGNAESYSYLFGMGFFIDWFGTNDLKNEYKNRLYKIENNKENNYE